MLTLTLPALALSAQKLSERIDFLWLLREQAIAKPEECDGYEQKELQRLKELIEDELVS